MKSTPQRILLGLALVCFSNTAFAAQDISGAQVYSQNFDTLPAATTFVNDSTIPGWYLYRPTGSYAYTSTDGSTAWAGGFYNLGATAAADRSLGSGATGNDFQKVVIFHNTGTNALKVTNISYATEVYLTNSNITSTETTRVATRVENSEAALTGGTVLGDAGTGPGLVTSGWQNDTLLTYTYPLQDPASQVLAPAFTQTTSGAPTASVIVGAGQYLAVRFTDVNATGNDAYTGLDDVSITFAELTQPEAGSVRLTNAALTYSQNFDSLGSAGGGDWINNGTIPYWYLGKVPNITTPALAASDGSGTWAGNFYNLGVTAATDRALGAGPTGGAYSKLLLFHNSSSATVKLSNVAFNIEVYRNNSTTVAETLTFATLIGDSEAALTTRINEASTPGGWLDDAPLTYTHPAPLAGEVALPVTVSVAKNAAPGSTITIPAGKYVALRWWNANDTGNDAYIGIDDLSVQFESLAGTITGEIVGLPTRNQNGTPSDPTDDKVEFNLKVTGTNVSTSWVTTAGPEGGNYGDTVLVSRPVGTTGVVVVPFHDTVDASIASSVTVTAPVNPAYISPTRNQVITFGVPAAGTSSTTRTEATVDLGWSSSTTTSALRTQPAPNNAAKYFDFSTAAATFTTEAVNLSEVANFKVQLGLSAYTTSTTGFEAVDLFDVIVESSVLGDFSDAVQVGKILDSTVTDGIALFDAVHATQFTANPANNAPGINYGVATDLTKTAYPSAAFGFKTYAGVYPKPAGANWVRLKITGVNEASEHLLVDNVLFTNAVPNLTPTISNVVRNDLNTQTESDDTIEFDLTVNQELAGTTGWTSNIPTTTAGTWTGAYGTPVHITTIAAVPLTINIADGDTPTITATAALTIPRHLFFGKVKVDGSATTDVKSIATAPTIFWQNDSANNIKHKGTAPTTFESQSISLTGFTGDFVFAAHLAANETSGSTNFETTDTFKLELVLTKTDNSEEVINLVQGHPGDLDNSGVLTGAAATIDDEFNLNNQPVAAQAGKTFDFTKTLPVAGYSAIKIRVIGGTNGGTFDAATGYGTNSEEFKLSALTLDLTSGFVDTDTDKMDDIWETSFFGSLAQTGTDDFDGDGSSNLTEYLAGTNPINPADSLKVSTIGANGNDITVSWTTVPGKNYQIQYSTDLTTWNTAVTTPATIPAAATPATSTATTFTNPLPTDTRVYFRAKVVP